MLEISHPLTGERLQVANMSFETKMNLSDANQACYELGEGWRLPTREELKRIYHELYKKGVGKYFKGYYWTSTEESEGHYYCLNLSEWKYINAFDDKRMYAHPVRSL